MDRTRTVRGSSVPTFLYGTAWKEDATERLVTHALEAGFRGFDTANQRKHYFEEGVGRALGRAFAAGTVRREDLFLQTKFTFARGQDHRLPYDREASIATQVEQSFRSSLVHLGVSSLDALVLHGPATSSGLVADDREAWRSMEAIARSGGARLLGISNVSADQLAALLEFAEIAPTFVQNRCYAQRGWDARVRAVCDSNGVVYQGFSLLTANRKLASGRVVASIAARHGRTAEQVIFRFAMHLGMLPLTGTTSPKHMKLDLEAETMQLTPEEIGAIASASSSAS